MLGMELRGKQLGIIGAGRIGRAVAAKAPAFGMRAVFAKHDMSLDELLVTSDVVSIHAPSTPETRHLINKRTLARMKRSAILVNTARGALVDEEALAWALGERLIAGAALDVYEREPGDQPALKDFENVLLAPHLGSATRETRTAMAELAVRNVLAVLNGDEPLTPSPAFGIRHLALKKPSVERTGRRRHAPAGEGDRRSRRARRREDREGPERRSLPGPHRDDAVGADQGCRDRRGIRAPVPRRPHAEDDGEAAGPRIRDAHLSGQLLSQQGGARPEDVRADHDALRRPRAVDDGGAADAAGRRPEDREPGADPVVPEPEEHLRRHARAPDLESPGLGDHAHAGRDRAGAVSGHPPPVVAHHQPVSRDLGAERLPPGVSSVPSVRAGGHLSEGRGDEGGQSWIKAEGKR